MSSYDAFWPKKSFNYIKEGAQREWLAQYFLTVPLWDEQSPQQQVYTKQALRLLLDIENRSILLSAGIPRPLLYGNLTGLLYAILRSSQVVAKRSGIYLSIHTADSFATPVLAAFEPRLIQMAVVGLIRASCLMNMESHVTACLYSSTNGLTITVTGMRPPQEAQALGVAKETARLHQGSLAISGGTVGLSIRTNLTQTGGKYLCPTAAQLLNSPLSSVQIGLFSSLDIE